MNNGVSAEELLKDKEVQEQFAGYYYDGKVNSATARQIENIILNK